MSGQLRYFGGRVDKESGWVLGGIVEMGAAWWNSGLGEWMFFFRWKGGIVEMGGGWYLGGKVE